MSKRKRVSADPQGVQTRYLEKVVIPDKSDGSAATENTGPTVPHFTPTPIRTSGSPASGTVYDINSKFELLNFCLCLTFSCMKTNFR